MIAEELEIELRQDCDIQQAVFLLEQLIDGPYSVWEDGSLLNIRHRVGAVGALEFHIYSNEHPPPHFHIKAAGIDASFSLEDCTLLDGRISKVHERKVKRWYKDKRALLIDVWNNTRPSGCTVGQFNEGKNEYQIR